MHFLHTRTQQNSHFVSESRVFNLNQKLSGCRLGIIRIKQFANCTFKMIQFRKREIILLKYEVIRSKSS